MSAAKQKIIKGNAKSLSTAVLHLEPTVYKTMALLNLMGEKLANMGNDCIDNNESRAEFDGMCMIADEASERLYAEWEALVKTMRACRAGRREAERN